MNSEPTAEEYREMYERSVVKESMDMMVDSIIRDRERAFYDGFRHGLAVQEEIFRDEHPEIAHADGHTDTTRRSQRRELVDALETLLEDRGVLPLPEGE